jgi:hypothetical protein
MNPMINMQQPQAPQEPQIPPPGPVQSGDLRGARWKQLRGKLKRIVADLDVALGSEDGAFPLDDESRFTNGEMDMDFEESSIEYLGDIQLKFMEGAAIAERFRYNLMVRSHDPEEPDEAPAGDNGTSS